MPGIRLWGVDAFADRPFTGNPAAVCLLPALPEADRTAGPDPNWMLAFAAEMNLSETAFLWPDSPPTGSPRQWQIRFFTPRVEVPLCGHATLASAHVLWQSGELPSDQPVRLLSRAGPLAARLEPGSEGDWIALDLPADPLEPQPVPAGLAAALGIQPLSTARGKRSGWWVADLTDAASVRALTPNLPALATLDLGALCVTARADAANPGCDFVSRFFAPSLGIPEDPVTGSIHAALATLWAGRLGKPELVGRQLSARGGVIRVRPKAARVEILGQAIMIYAGHLAL